MDVSVPGLTTIFNGEESLGPVAGQLLRIGTFPDELALTCTLPASVSYGPEGLLLVTSEHVTAENASLDDWSGDSLFISGAVIFCPWRIVDRIHLIVAEDQLAITEITLYSEEELVVGFQMSADDKDELLEYMDESRCISKGLNDWPEQRAEISDALRNILLEGGVLRIDEIEEKLQAEGWDFDSETIGSILADSGFAAAQVEHLWFLSDGEPPDEDDLTELAIDVLAALKEEPRTGADVLDYLQQTGWGDDLTIDDVYDVLYDADMPTWKCPQGWFIPEEDISL